LLVHSREQKTFRHPMPFLSAGSIEPYPPGGPDSKILDWYASHGHRVSDIAGIFVLAISAAFFLWFLGYLRATLRSAEGAGGRAGSIAIASGTAFIVLLAVAGSSFTAIAFVVSEAGSEFTLDPNTFRLLSGFGFLTYVVAFMLASPLAFGVGVVAWQTRLPPLLAGGRELPGRNRGAGQLHLHHNAHRRRLDPSPQRLPRVPAFRNVCACRAVASDVQMLDDFTSTPR